MKWWLIIQLTSTWPQSPPPVQIQGPFDDVATCSNVKEQFDALLHGARAKCISVPQGPQK